MWGIETGQNHFTSLSRRDDIDYLRFLVGRGVIDIILSFAIPTFLLVVLHDKTKHTLL